MPGQPEDPSIEVAAHRILVDVGHVEHQRIVLLPYRSESRTASTQQEL